MEEKYVHLSVYERQLNSAVSQATAQSAESKGISGCKQESTVLRIGRTVDCREEVINSSLMVRHKAAYPNFG
jgi:putative NIF3 family GTP cyclohydrolase 1 type 2